MKSGKAVGVDGIPVELLEAAGLPAVEAIQKLCDEAYRTEKIPEEWQQGVICPIYKKKEGDQPCLWEPPRHNTAPTHCKSLLPNIREESLKSRLGYLGRVAVWFQTRQKHSRPNICNEDDFGEKLGVE